MFMHLIYSFNLMYVLFVLTSIVLYLYTSKGIIVYPKNRVISNSKHDNWHALLLYSSSTKLSEG